MSVFLDHAAHLAVFGAQWDAYAAQLDGTNKLVRPSSDYSITLGPIGRARLQEEG
jgi:hypothetical protein